MTVEEPMTAVDTPAPPRAAPAPPAPPAEAGGLALARDAVLRSYSQVLFSGSRATGAVLLAATLVVPEVGLLGLFGAAVSNALAALLGQDRAALRQGLLGYDGLLLCVVLGASFAPSPALLAVAALGCLLAVLLHVALEGVLRRLLLLPALSLPFVLAGWLVLPLLGFTRGVSPRATAAAPIASLPGLPESVDGLLAALGAVFAVPHAAAGLLVLVGLGLWSRIAATHAVVGAGVAAALLAALVDLPLGVDPVLLRFNVVLAAVALGGVFTVPGAASLAVAAGGALVTGLLTVALGQALGVVGWPVLALPFNLGVLLVLVALGQRRMGASPPLVVAPGRNPEETLRQHHATRRRFGRSLPVALRLPFRGDWVCTQGNDGPHTHQGAWRHGLDFEVLGEDGRTFRGQGDRVTDYHCYGRPVIAMAVGTVVEVVDGIPDNPPRQVDAARSWGNLVVVQHGPALFSLVAHLQPRSVRVQPGDVVQPGQVLGRCGSSGRSPVPHLHVQLQASPTVGAPTVPVAFHAVRVWTEGPATLAWERCPVAGERVGGWDEETGLRRALRLAPGARTSLRCVEGGATTTQRVESRIDALGVRSLVDPASGARLRFDLSDGVFTTLDYRGPRAGALFALGLALPRLPLTSAPLRWTDHLDRARLDGLLARALWEWAAAVLPPPSVALALESRPEGDAVVVTGRGAGLRTEARIAPVEGVSATVRLGDRRLEVACTSC